MTADWRVADSLLTLRGQLDALAPQRSRASDGFIGNADHAARDSDHNPHVRLGSQYYVTAGDFTHDPRGGLDCARLAAALRDGRDRRVKYVIWCRHIMAGFGGPAPWTWRPYRGANAHEHHLHVSVVPDARALLRIDWLLPKVTQGVTSGGANATQPAPVLHSQPLTTSRPSIRRGDGGALVALLQRWLGVPDDGVFGEATEAAVRRYQAMRGLLVDGVVGPRTWLETGL